MISAALDDLQLSRLHMRLLLIAGLGYMFDGLDGSALAFFLPVLKMQWGLSAWQASMIASSTSVGYLFGSFASGFLADRIGRKRVMMTALAFYCVASCLSALAYDWRVYCALRVLCGVGTGAEAVVIIPYIAEFLPARLRGGLCGAVVGFYSFGYVAAALIGVGVVSRFPDGWRLASFMTGAPVLLLLWWRRALPESPRWLEARGQVDKAREVVARFGANVRAQGAGPIAGPIDTTVILRDRHWVFRIGLCIWIWTFLFFAFYGIFAWIPSLLMQRGMNLSQSFGVSFLIFAAQIPGYFVAAWMNGVIGRRRVMIGAFCVAALAAAFLATAPATMGVIIAAMGLSAGLNGSVAGLYAYTPELFPTEIRATAMGLASGVSRLGAIGGAFGIGLLSSWGGSQLVFSVIGAALALAVLPLLTVAPETKNAPLPELG